MFCALVYVVANPRVQFEKSLPEETDLRLVESVERNTKRYIDVFSQAVDAVMPKETKEITYASSRRYVDATN